MKEKVDDLVLYLNCKYDKINYTLTETPKYYRIHFEIMNKIFSESPFEITYCFITKEDLVNKKLGFVPKGSILKPETHNTPAKGVRASVFDPSNWDVRLERYYPAYFK